MPCRQSLTYSLLLSSFLMLATTGCEQRDDSKPKELQKTGLNLVLVSIDTLRSDRLKNYGYKRATSPNLDSFANRSVTFDYAIAPASWTLPSHVSLFSGLYPTSHGVVASNKRRLVPETPFLAEILKEKGYHTFAFTGGGYLSQAFGFGKGFDTFVNTRLGKPDLHHEFEVATKDALKTIESLPSNQNFFIFLHTYDVHCPYAPPEKFNKVFSTPSAEYLDPDNCAAKSFEKKGLTKGQVEYISNLYDESILAVDQVFGDLIAKLEELGRMNNTIVIVTSDHGEEFNEHGKIGHKASLFRELLLVPLIIYVPKITARRITSTVSLVDVVPTVLDLLKISNTTGLDGKSLLPLLNGNDQKLREFQFAELDRGPKLRSSWGNGYHLIMNLKDSTSVLFDYKSDPFEQHNLALADPILKGKEEERLRKFLSTLTPRALKPVEGKSANDEKESEVEQLQTLGYL